MKFPKFLDICQHIFDRSIRRSNHIKMRSKGHKTSRRSTLERLELRQMLAADIATDMRVSPYFFIGDHSNSNSESWQMNVSGVGSISAGFGQVTRVMPTLQAGNSHVITVQHLGTNRTKKDSSGNSALNPDYDYRAWVDDRATPAWTDGQSTPSSNKWFVQNNSGLLQKRFFGGDGSSNPTSGKVAWLHLPSLDMDVDTLNRGSASRSSEEDIAEQDESQGKFIPLLSGDIDSDGTADIVDGQIAGASFTPFTVSLSSNLVHAGANNLSQRLQYAAASFGQIDGDLRIWTKDASSFRTNNDLVVPGTPITGLSPGETRTFFIEAVKPSNRTVNFAPIDATLTVDGAIWSGVLTDRVHVRGISADLDVDSNNNGQIDDTYFGVQSEELIEFKSDKLGRVVFVNNDDSDGDGIIDLRDGFNADGVAGNQDDQSNNEKSFVPIELRLPNFGSFSDLTVDLDYDVLSLSSESGRGLRLWTGNNDVNRTRDPLASKLIGDSSTSYFVPSGSYSVADLRRLGFSELNRNVTLYIEAGARSEELADYSVEVTVKEGAKYEVSDLVRLTAVETFFSGPDEVSVDVANATVSAGIVGRTIDEVEEFIDGKQAKFTFTNPAGVTTSKTDAFFAGLSGASFDTRDFANETYNVLFEFLGQRRMLNFKTIPGIVDSIQVDFPSGNSPLIGATLDNRLVRVRLQDAHGNNVADGTQVSWTVIQGDNSGLVGELVHPPQNLPFASTVNGEAFARVYSPGFQVNGLVQIRVEADSSTRDFSLTVVPANIVSSAANPTSIPRNSSQGFVLSFTTNAPDGTPVYFRSSNGIIGSSHDPQFSEGVVSNGQASVAVRTDDEWSRVGTGVVTATVGDRTAIQQYTVTTSNSGPEIELEFFVIVGDRVPTSTTPDIESWNLLDGVVSIPGHSPRSEFNQVRSQAYKSWTTAKIWGTPGGTYEVGFTELIAGQLLDILDDQGQPVSEVTIGANGYAEIYVVSRGQLAGGVERVTLYAQELIYNPFVGGAPVRGASVGTKLVVTEVTAWTRTKDALWGFIGGDTTTVAGIARNVAGGVFIVGDVGSIAKNSWRGIGFSSVPVNKIETSLSALGLLTEVAVGAGETVDVPVSIVRAIVVAVGKNPFSDALIELLRRGLNNAYDMGQLAKALPQLICSQAAFDTARAVLTSNELLEGFVKTGGRLEDASNPANQIGENLIDTLTKIATQSSIEAAQAGLKVLNSLNDGVIARLRGLPQADFDDVVLKLGRIVFDNATNKAIDPDSVAKMLNDLPAQLFEEPTYGLTRLVTDLDQLRLREGFTSIFGYLKGQGDYATKYGFFYEIKAAASLQRITGQPATLQRIIKTPFGNTDIDVLVDGVYFQVKSAASALKRQINPSAPSNNPVQWIKAMDDWIGKAKSDMVAKGLPVKIRYYVPNLVDVPDELMAHVTKLSEAGLDIDWVSEIGFVKNW